MRGWRCREGKKTPAERSHLDRAPDAPVYAFVPDFVPSRTMTSNADESELPTLDRSLQSAIAASCGEKSL